MAKGQKSRKSKTSNGINGGGGKMDRPFTNVEKVLLGGGMIHRPRPKKK